MPIVLPSAPSVLSIGVRFLFPITDPDPATHTSLNPTGIVDLTLYGIKEVIFLPPGGSPLTRTAVALNPPGADGVLMYENDATFFNAVKGRWHVRGHIKADATHEYFTVWESFYAGA